MAYQEFINGGGVLDHVKELDDALKQALDAGSPDAPQKRTERNQYAYDTFYAGQPAGTRPADANAQTEDQVRAGLEMAARIGIDRANNILRNDLESLANETPNEKWFDILTKTREVREKIPSFQNPP